MLFEIDILITQMFIPEWNTAKEEPAQPDLVPEDTLIFRGLIFKGCQFPWNQKWQNLSCINQQKFSVVHSAYPLWIVNQRFRLMEKPLS